MWKIGVGGILFCRTKNVHDDSRNRRPWILTGRLVQNVKKSRSATIADKIWTNFPYRCCTKQSRNFSDSINRVRDGSRNGLLNDKVESYTVNVTRRPLNSIGWVVFNHPSHSSNFKAFRFPFVHFLEDAHG